MYCGVYLSLVKGARAALTTWIFELLTLMFFKTFANDSKYTGVRFPTKFINVNIF